MPYIQFVVRSSILRSFLLSTYILTYIERVGDVESSLRSSMQSLKDKMSFNRQKKTALLADRDLRVVLDENVQANNNVCNDLYIWLLYWIRIHTYTCTHIHTYIYYKRVAIYTGKHGRQLIKENHLSQRKRRCPLSSNR